MTRLRGLLAFVLLPWLAAAPADYLSARRKFQQIGDHRVRPGTTVRLSQIELNAFVETEARKVPGVSAPRLALGDGRAEGWLVVDFLKLKQASGDRPGWLMSQVLSGERPVYVRTRIESAAGQATVHVERVEINGLGIEGQPLEFLIRNYVRAYYPEAKVGEPFELGYSIEQIDLAPEGVAVRIGGSQVAARPR